MKPTTIHQLLTNASDLLLPRVSSHLISFSFDGVVTLSSHKLQLFRFLPCEVRCRKKMGESVEEKIPSLAEQPFLSEKEDQTATNDNLLSQDESFNDPTPHKTVTEKSEETPTAEITDEIPSEDKSDETQSEETPTAEKTDEIPSEDKSDETPAIQDSDVAPVAEETDNEPSEQTRDVSPVSTAEESSETPEEEQSEENAEEQEVVEEKAAIKIETAPADFRFPTTNQTRHCFTRYIEYHRCIQAKGEDAEECNKFARYYRSLCPTEWVERWNEQRENGTFPGPL